MKVEATLVGDGVENPGNARVMVHAAEMFGAACRFRDTKGLAESPDEIANFATISGSELQTLHSRIIAFDNIPDAVEVYGFRAGRDFALLVGNERRGLSHEFVKAAADRVYVPMISRQINCLNVAAAAAVGLYYLCGTPVAPMSIRQNPGSRRPEVLLLGAGDHVEVGSAIRSAAALGWNRLFLEDRYQTWFGCDRVIRSESRAAARRGRNDILCIPAPEKASHAFARVTVITRQPGGIPLRRVNLARGTSQLIVIPDESRVEATAEEWSRFGKQIEFANPQIPAVDFAYHYRLITTIVLAEVSRQVGRRLSVKPSAGPRPPIYDRRLLRLAETTGQVVRWEDLLDY